MVPAQGEVATDQVAELGARPPTVVDSVGAEFGRTGDGRELGIRYPRIR